MLYDIGGRRLFLESAGEGSPTVLFEAGAGSSSSTWDPIWSSVMAFTRVCRYDRVNLGQSDKAPNLRSLHDVVEDLHALLKTASVPGPYVMVGHSFGGLVVRLYAHHYPKDILGVVFIDSSHPEQNKRSLDLLPSPVRSEDQAITASRTRYSDPNTGLPEGINFGRSLTEVSQTGDLGHIPIAVISRSRPTSLDGLQRVRPGLPPKIAAALEDLWQELQLELLSLSKESTHVIADLSGHYVHHDQPAVVVDAVYKIVQMACGYRT